MTSITLTDALEAYTEDVLRNRAAATQKKADWELERFRLWVIKEAHRNFLLEDVDSNLVKRYFLQFRPPACEPSTFNLYVTRLRVFFKFCQGEGWIKVDPTRRIEHLPVPKKIRTMPSARELGIMLDTAPYPRDRAILAVHIHTVLRGGDVAALKIGSVNFDDMVIDAYIKKTRKVLNLPMGQELRDELLAWFASYTESMGLDSIHDLDDSWPLLPKMLNVFGVDGERIIRLMPDSGPHLSMRNVIHAALNRVGIDKKGDGTHTMRRAGLRLYHDMAAHEGDPDPLGVAQTMAGHEQRSTTEIYLGITPETRRRDKLIKGRPFLKTMEAVAEALASGDLAATQAAFERHLAAVNDEPEDGMGVAAHA